MSNTSTTTTTPAPEADEHTQDNEVARVETKAGEVVVAVGTPPPGTTVQLNVPAEYAGQFAMMLANLSSGMHPDGLRSAVDAQRAAIANDETNQSTNEQVYKDHQDRLKKLGINEKNAVTPEMVARELRAADQLLAQTLKMDYAPEGGKSIVNGVEVWNLTGLPVQPGEKAPRELFAGERPVQPWELGEVDPQDERVSP